MTGFAERGWQRFGAEPATRDWVAAALPAARAAQGDPRHAQWWRHGRTWFAGVNVLDNDTDGRVGDGPALAGAAVGFARALGTLAGPAWDHAQVSVVRPGYPRRDAGESEAAHRFRKLRDAAHLDGLLAEGADRRRFIREPHAFILGIGLTKAEAGAAPLVVWQGSHDGCAPRWSGRWGTIRRQTGMRSISPKVLGPRGARSLKPARGLCLQRWPWRGGGSSPAAAARRRPLASGRAGCAGRPRQCLFPPAHGF
ncbi:MAG: hypothetical protein R3D84_13125 [Paracoccaceae bacterium]